MSSSSTPAPRTIPLWGAILFFLGGTALCLTFAFLLKTFFVIVLDKSLPRLMEEQVLRIARLKSSSPVRNPALLLFGDSTATFSIDASRFPSADSFAAGNSTSLEAYFILRDLLRAGS